VSVPLPLTLAALYVWSFGVLSAAQVTIRLIMAYKLRLTLVAALLLTIAALLIGVVEQVLIGSSAGLAQRIQLMPLLMLMMAIAGFGIARWVLRIKRLRGQVVAAIMIGLLDPHLFTLL
jgi:hypothetical protein